MSIQEHRKPETSDLRCKQHILKRVMIVMFITVEMSTLTPYESKKKWEQCSYYKSLNSVLSSGSLKSRVSVDWKIQWLLPPDRRTSCESPDEHLETNKTRGEACLRTQVYSLKTGVSTGWPSMDLLRGKRHPCFLPSAPGQYGFPWTLSYGRKV